LVLASLLRLYPAEAAEKWLLGLNSHLGDRRPIDLVRAGRHDNPDLYGCLYVSEEPISAVAELLAPFRGAGTLLPSMLVRFGLPLALASLELPDKARFIDLDDPVALSAEGLRPSRVATRHRSITQGQAAEIHALHPEVIAIRWWSTLEASWINWTLRSSTRRGWRTHPRRRPATLDRAGLDFSEAFADRDRAG
jgi:RES domain